jgi:hypothetical protein
MLRDMAHLNPHITFLNELDIAPELVRGDLVLVPVRELSALRQKLVLACRLDSALDPATYLVAQEIKGVLDASVDSISEVHVKNAG